MKEINVSIHFRFLLWQIIAIAVLSSMLMVQRHIDRKSSTPRPIPQEAHTITLDPGQIDTGPNAWIINPLRAARAEWKSNEDGRYTWLIGPLKEKGLTPSDVLEFCYLFMDTASTP